jgi:hypothetical protein
MIWRLRFGRLRTIRGSRYLLLLLSLSALLVAYPFWSRDVIGLATVANGPDAPIDGNALFRSFG